MDEYTPPTEPSGSLVPPPRGPTTALALSTPEPPIPPRRLEPYMKSFSIEQLLRRTFDTIDEVADTLAEGLGIR